MRLFILCILFSVAHTAFGQVNVGREYGNPTMPWVVSHLPKDNQGMLLRATSPRHFFGTKIICFKKICRVQIGRHKALHAISFEKFQRKIKRRAKHNQHKKVAVDTVSQRKAPPPKVPQKPKPKVDSVKTLPTVVATPPTIKTDSLIVLGGELLFETNSATLASDHFATLNSIAKFLVEHPNLVVKVSGHTDNQGTESHNVSLSTRRANVVAEYLVYNGVLIERVSSVGLGSSKPIAPNTTTEGRQKNRRVELLIHDGQ